MERTLIILKPDCIKNKQVGKVISILEDQKFIMKRMKLQELDEETVKAHYDQHKNKSFFNDLVNFMISGPVVTMIMEGENIVKRAREIIGNKNPMLADSKTIRARFAASVDENVIHGSDSIESAEREISIFF